MPDNEVAKPDVVAWAPLSQSRVRINIYIQRSIYEQAMDIAREEEESMSYVVREALKRYIKAHKSQVEEG